MNDQNEQLVATMNLVRAVLPQLARLADGTEFYRLAVLSNDVTMDLIAQNVESAKRHYVVFSEAFVEFLVSYKEDDNG